MQGQVTEEDLELIKVEYEMKFLKFSDVKVKEKLERTPLIVF